ncbi:hypothetical protein DAT35_46545 [Vitiosangium sp. GDMCC 1.1324]|nr:hypothetical protein DAT35_46545 [Vitiosangium sp. GDMCC 1.1324]
MTLTISRMAATAASAAPASVSGTMSWVEASPGHSICLFLAAAGMAHPASTAVSTASAYSLFIAFS